MIVRFVKAEQARVPVPSFVPPNLMDLQLVSSLVVNLPAIQVTDAELVALDPCRLPDVSADLALNY